LATYKVKGVKQGKVLYSSGPTTIAEEQIVFLRSVGLDVPRSDIDFLGDGQVQTMFSIDKVVATIEVDKYTEALFERLYGKSDAAQTGEISRYYFGETAEEAPPDVGLQIDLQAVEDATGTERTLRVTLYKGKAQPYTVPSAASKEKHGMAWTFEAVKTATDLITSAIPSVPTGGAYYSIAILSS